MVHSASRPEVSSFPNAPDFTFFAQNLAESPLENTPSYVRLEAETLLYCAGLTSSCSREKYQLCR